VTACCIGRAVGDGDRVSGPRACVDSQSSNIFISQ
jgi:hypothetical protein